MNYKKINFILNVENHFCISSKIIKKKVFDLITLTKLILIKRQKHYMLFKNYNNLNKINFEIIKRNRKIKILVKKIKKKLKF